LGRRWGPLPRLESSFLSGLQAAESLGRTREPSNKAYKDCRSDQLNARVREWPGFEAIAARHFEPELGLIDFTKDELGRGEGPLVRAESLAESQ